LSSGLGEDWERILDDLRVLAPIYEKGNRVLSFGRSPRIRREALRAGLPTGGVFVDVGSGPGSMSVEAKRMRPSLEPVLLDPLPEMLALAARDADLWDANLVEGTYEFLPFRDASFHGYLAGFTLRDARDRELAIREANRALADGGSALIVDLGRPDSFIKRSMVMAYWRLLAPILLFIFLRSEGRRFRDIYITVKKLPRNSQISSLFSGVFGNVRTKGLMLDGVLILVARKGGAQAVDMRSSAASALK
jgi:demethylmenaquinone methyltransferase/2-methoxy-6-polyprenyl-1,4-benzoquinol methylase